MIFIHIDYFSIRCRVMMWDVGTGRFDEFAANMSEAGALRRKASETIKDWPLELEDNPRLIGKVCEMARCHVADGYCLMALDLCKAANRMLGLDCDNRERVLGMAADCSGDWRMALMAISRNANVCKEG